MKYVIFLGDGMSDEPLEELQGRTPLQVADTPGLDRIVREGIGGSTRNVPDHLPPGSDVCNLGVLGYDLRQGYTGRSPIEAAAMDVDLDDTDVAIRCNLVSYRQENGQRIMDDFSAGHIDTETAHRVMELIQRELGNEEFAFTPGVSYRHLLVWHGGSDQMQATPPHDIAERAIDSYLPQGEGSDPIRQLMRASEDILADCHINRERQAAGLKPVSSIWLWGQGRRPSFESFEQKWGLRGSMITAVDLMRGIARHLGMTNLHVEGATGWIDTNYRGKAQACIDALPDTDLVYIHVESPDESGHAGSIEYKLQAITDFDYQVVQPVLEHLDHAWAGQYRVCCLPDHPTPIALRTHTREFVPFGLMGAGITPDECTKYDESLLQCGTRLPYSPDLMKTLIS